MKKQVRKASSIRGVPLHPVPWHNASGFVWIRSLCIVHSFSARERVLPPSSILTPTIAITAKLCYHHRNIKHVRNKREQIRSTGTTDTCNRREAKASHVSSNMLRCYQASCTTQPMHGIVCRYCLAEINKVCLQSSRVCRPCVGVFVRMRVCVCVILVHYKTVGEIRFTVLCSAFIDPFFCKEWRRSQRKVKKNSRYFSMKHSQFTLTWQSGEISLGDETEHEWSPSKPTAGALLYNCVCVHTDTEYFLTYLDDATIWKDCHRAKTANGTNYNIVLYGYYHAVHILCCALRICSATYYTYTT